MARQWVSPRATTVRWSVRVVPVLVLFWGFLALGMVLLPHTVQHLRVAGEPTTARVVDSVDSGVLVEYVHRDVGTVRTTIHRDVLAVGDEVAIFYERVNPYKAIAAQGGRTDTRLPMAFPALGFALSTALSYAAMRTASRRARALAADDSPAFAMLAVVRDARWSSVPRLMLYPVDVRPGDAPICTLRLADQTAQTESPMGFDHVDVKGFPRPGGRVIVRRGQDVLWPRGRALLAGRTPWAPAQGHQRYLAPPIPPARPTVPAGERMALAAFGVGLFATALTIAVALHHREQVAAWNRTAEPAVATVTGTVGSSTSRITVDVVGGDRAANDAPVAMATEVGYAEDYDIGRVYPAVWSADHTKVRLLAQPYDALAPVLWAVVPTVVAAYAVLQLSIGRRLGYDRRPARRGAWPSAYPDPTRHLPAA